MNETVNIDIPASIATANGSQYNRASGEPATITHAFDNTDVYKRQALTIELDPDKTYYLRELEGSPLMQDGYCLLYTSRCV